MMCASRDIKCYISKKGKGAVNYDPDDLSLYDIVLKPKKGTKVEKPLKKKHTLKSCPVEVEEVVPMGNVRKHTLWSYYFEGNVEIPEICVFSITLQCPDENGGCSRLHAKKMMHWQILRNDYDDGWCNLHEMQSDYLERAYQDIETNEVVIPPLDPVKSGKLGQHLMKLLGKNRLRANFRQMKLENLDQTISFKIRRVSTPSTETLKSKYATEFKWYYFVATPKKWLEFGQQMGDFSDNIDLSDPKVFPTTSSEIEKQFQKGQCDFMMVITAQVEFKLDFTKMELTLGNNGRAVLVRRRPKGNVNMKSTWRRYTVWSYYYNGDVEVPEICIYSLNSECPEENEGCSKLHAKKKWHWQIMNDGMWFNLLSIQSDCLERAFQKVEIDEVFIPAIYPAKGGKIGRDLMKLLGTEHLQADFRQMKLFRLKKQRDFPVRRLSTPSVEILRSEYSTEYRWFYKEEEEGWREFVKHSEVSECGNAELYCFKSLSHSSAEIEESYQINQRGFIMVKVAHMEHKLDFSEMQLKCKTIGRVLPVRRRPRSYVTAPGVWSYQIQGNVQIPEICLSSDENSCVLLNGCGRLHSRNPWHWQFIYRRVWYNMPVIQNETLEKKFQNVREGTAELKEINPSKMGKRGEVLQKILGTTKWHAEFETMTMTNSCDSKLILRIRRLSIPFTPTSVDNNGFVWYFKDENEIWVEIGCIENADEMHLCGSLLTSSHDIEKCYQSGKSDLMDVTVSEGCFELSLSSMTLRNKITQNIMPVRRRPQSILSGKPDSKSQRNITKD